jgi:hypothetical protein
MRKRHQYLTGIRLAWQLEQAAQKREETVDWLKSCAVRVLHPTPGYVRSYIMRCPFKPNDPHRMEIDVDKDNYLRWRCQGHRPCLYVNGRLERWIEHTF